MKRGVKLIILSLIVITGLSCERLVMPKKKSNTNTQIFDELWRTINNGYAYFDLKGINWDSVQFDYQTQRVADTLLTRPFFDTCAQMLSILKDPRVVLNAGFATYQYMKPFPYSENFSKRLMENKYWVGAERTGPLLYKVIDSVSYMYYADFDKDINEDQINAIIERLKQLGGKKGMILDVRNSVGSNTQNMYTLFNHMGYDTSGYDYSTYLFQTAYRSGAGKDQFTDWVGTFIDKNDKKKLAKKIRVLTNRRMYGVPNLFAAGSGGFFNVKVMGDTTGGGAGLVSSHELSNGWVVTYTSSKIRMANGDYMEDGVPPDTVIQLTATDDAAGKDTILEAALADLLKK